ASRRVSNVRTCGSVRAGVAFFPPTGFLYQEPQRQKRERLMVIPTPPGADFVMGQTGFAFGPLDTLLDPMLRVGHSCELGARRVGGSIAEIVIILPHAVLVLGADH